MILPVALLSDFLQTPLQLRGLVLKVSYDSVLLRLLENGNLWSMKASLLSIVLVTGGLPKACVANTVNIIINYYSCKIWKHGEQMKLTWDKCAILD